MTIRRSARMSAGLMRANRASKRVGAGLEFADHRDYARGRRSPLPRLEPVRPARAAGAAAVPGGRGPAGRGAGRRQRLDGRRQPAQAGSGAAGRRGAGVRRRSRTWIAWRVTPLGDDEAPVAAAGARQGGDPADPAFSRRRARERARRRWRAAVRAFLARRRRRRRGLAIVISDFYDPAGHRAALDLLRHHRLEVVAIQVSAPQELAPDVRGDVELRDVETGETRELTVSPAVLAAYRQRHQTLLRDLEGYCRERAIPCFAVVSDQAFDAVVLRMFRAGGLLALSGRDGLSASLLSGPLPARAALSRARSARSHHGALPGAPAAPARGGVVRAALAGRRRSAPHDQLGAATARPAVAAAGAGVAGPRAARGGRSAARRRRPRRAQPGHPDRSLRVDVGARRTADTRLDAARARATAIVDGLAAAGPGAGRVVRRPTPSPRAGSRPTRAGCAARSRPSHPARSPAICRAR